MSKARSTGTLTGTSYVVLGLLEQHQPATPYELKQAVAHHVGYFWSVPHTQLYDEPARLTRAGYLHERQEQSGRRRKLYTLTSMGREALREWRSGPSIEVAEIRDHGLLQLFFGAPAAPLAEAQVTAHQQRLKLYESLLAAAPSLDLPDRVRWVIEAGAGHEREWLRFWRDVAREAPDDSTEPS